MAVILHLSCVPAVLCEAGSFPCVQVVRQALLLLFCPTGCFLHALARWSSLQLLLMQPAGRVVKHELCLGTGRAGCAKLSQKRFTRIDSLRREKFQACCRLQNPCKLMFGSSGNFLDQGFEHSPRSFLEEEQPSCLGRGGSGWDTVAHCCALLPFIYGH